MKWGADFATTFQQEFSARAGETTANILTIGGYGGVKQAYAEGRVTSTDSFSGVKAYAEGVFSTITLGGGESAVDAYAEGEGTGGVALGAAKGVGETVLPINEVKTLADSEKNGWEKAEAVATGATKVAGLLAGGLAAKNALARRLPNKPGVVTESPAGAEATMAPAEGVVRPAAPAARRAHPVGQRLPNGRIAGEGPGAALRNSSEFTSGTSRGVVDKSWKSIVEGKAHGTTPGHKFRSYRKAIEMAKSGQYEKVHLNRGYRKTTGTNVAPNRRPDVTGVRKTGEIDVVEVPSASDIPTVLRDRNVTAQGQLPSHRRGRIDIESIR